MSEAVSFVVNASSSKGIFFPVPSNGGGTAFVNPGSMVVFGRLFVLSILLLAAPSVFLYGPKMVIGKAVSGRLPVADVHQQAAQLRGLRAGVDQSLALLSVVILLRAATNLMRHWLNTPDHRLHIEPVDEEDYEDAGEYTYLVDHSHSGANDFEEDRKPKDKHCVITVKGEDQEKRHKAGKLQWLPLSCDAYPLNVTTGMN